MQENFLPSQNDQEYDCRNYSKTWVYSNKNAREIEIKEWQINADVWFACRLQPVGTTIIKAKVNLCKSNS